MAIRQNQFFCWILMLLWSEEIIIYIGRMERDQLCLDLMSALPWNFESAINGEIYTMYTDGFCLSNPLVIYHNWVLLMTWFLSTCSASPSSSQFTPCNWGHLQVPLRSTKVYNGLHYLHDTDMIDTQEYTWCTHWIMHGIPGAGVTWLSVLWHWSSMEPLTSQSLLPWRATTFEHRNHPYWKCTNPLSIGLLYTCVNFIFDECLMQI